MAEHSYRCAGKLEGEAVVADAPANSVHMRAGARFGPPRWLPLRAPPPPPPSAVWPLRTLQVRAGWKMVLGIKKSDLVWINGKFDSDWILDHFLSTALHVRLRSCESKNIYLSIKD